MRKISFLETFTILNISTLLVYFFLPDISKLVLAIPFATVAVLYVLRRD